MLKNTAIKYLWVGQVDHELPKKLRKHQKRPKEIKPPKCGLVQCSVFMLDIGPKGNCITFVFQSRMGNAGSGLLTLMKEETLPDGELHYYPFSDVAGVVGLSSCFEQQWTCVIFDAEKDRVAIVQNSPATSQRRRRVPPYPPASKCRTKTTTTVWKLNADELSMTAEDYNDAQPTVLDTS